MAWYVAHAILYVRHKSGEQTSFPVWENLYLISAENPDEAMIEARQLGMAATGDSDGTFTWEERPSEWVFAGIRKLISVSHRGENETPSSGDELSYSEFEVQDLTRIKELVAGNPAVITYVE